MLFDAFVREPKQNETHKQATQTQCGRRTTNQSRDRFRVGRIIPLVAMLTVIAIVVIGLGAFTDALEQLWKFSSRHTAANATPSLATPSRAVSTPAISANPRASIQAPSDPSLAILPTPAPEPSEAELMVSTVEAARPLQRRKTADAYSNIPVDWKLYFSGGDMAERAMTLHFDTSLARGHNVRVMLMLLTNGHEDFALLDVGAPMRVRGRVEMVDRFIALKDAQEERWPPKA